MLRNDYALSTNGDFQILVEDSPPPRSFIDRVVDGVDKITKLPGKIDESAERFSDGLRNSLSSLKERSAKKAEQNIRSQTITGYFSKFGRWIQQGNNALYVGGAALIVMFLIFRK